MLSLAGDHTTTEQTKSLEASHDGEDTGHAVSGRSEATSVRVAEGYM
jgi:hypothetical protein